MDISSNPQMSESLSVSLVCCYVYVLYTVYIHTGHNLMGHAVMIN